MPYFTDDDIPEPCCEGSFIELDWEGTSPDDPTFPRLICPFCSINLGITAEEVLCGPKKGLFFASVPIHYPGSKLSSRDEDDDVPYKSVYREDKE